MADDKTRVEGSGTGELEDPRSTRQGGGTLSESALMRIALYLERSRIAEYVDLMSRPGRLVYLNLLAGLARGVGLAVGFTLLGALVIYVLTRSFLLNLPVIGEFLGELVYIVQQYLRHRP